MTAASAVEAGFGRSVGLDGGGRAAGLYIYRLPAVAGAETHVATGRVVRVH